MSDSNPFEAHPPAVVGRWGRFGVTPDEAAALGLPDDASVADISDRDLESMLAELRAAHVAGDAAEDAPAGSEDVEATDTPDDEHDGAESVTESESDADVSQVAPDSE